MERFDRSARFWLRAYPRHWRAERADEVTEVLRDLAAADARRVDLRTAVGLVRAGVAARWRETPPPRVYLPYRVLGVRVPAPYREWVYRDLTSPGYLRRDLLWRSWIFALPLYQLVAGDDRAFTLGLWAVTGVAIAATLLLVRRGPARRRRLAYHVRPRVAEHRRLGDLSWVAVPRTRFAAAPAAAAWTTVLSVGAVAWSLAAVAAPTQLVGRRCTTPGSQLCSEIVTGERTGSPVFVAGLLVVASMIGIALGRTAGARLGRRLPGRPHQPARLLVGFTARGVAGVALWCLLVVAAALAEVVGAWPLSLSFVAAPACLVLLPVAVVGVRHARATPDLALVDLVRAAWTDTPVDADRPLLVPVPVQEAR